MIEMKIDRKSDCPSKPFQKYLNTNENNLTFDHAEPLVTPEKPTKKGAEGTNCSRKPKKQRRSRTTFTRFVS